MATAHSDRNSILIDLFRHEIGFYNTMYNLFCVIVCSMLCRTAFIEQKDGIFMLTDWLGTIHKENWAHRKKSIN